MHTPHDTLTLELVGSVRAITFLSDCLTGGAEREPGLAWAPEIHVDIAAVY